MRHALQLNPAKKYILLTSLYKKCKGIMNIDRIYKLKRKEMRQKIRGRGKDQKSRDCRNSIQTRHDKNFKFTSCA